MFIYMYSFVTAKRKASEEYGWNLGLAVTALIMPVALPIAVVVGIHSFLDKKLRF